MLWKSFGEKMERLCHYYCQQVEELLRTSGEKLKSYYQYMDELSSRYGGTFETYGENTKSYGEAIQNVLPIAGNSGEMSEVYGARIEMMVPKMEFMKLDFVCCTLPPPD